MVAEYKGQKFITDNDLDANIIGFWPRVDIKKRELSKEFKKVYKRSFLGGDEIVSYAQVLVSQGMDFASLEKEVLKDIKNPEKGNIQDLIFKKTATGIGRGHSLGGLSGIVLGVHGTKMIDSGLTGFVASRSLVTSSRRRESKTEEIIIPESLLSRNDLVDEYLEISREIFNASNEFKNKFGKLEGIETFNKITPYNSPADLFIVMSLDTLATLNFEVTQERMNNTKFIPRELMDLSDKMFELTKECGINTMYEQRIRVPRDTYLHYTIFKDPAFQSYISGLTFLKGRPIEPLIIDMDIEHTPNFDHEIRNLCVLFEKTKKTNNPEELAVMAMKSMFGLRNFVNEFNEAVRIKIFDSLSWRVWSEQKRHATLRQNVESVYSAADSAYKNIKPFWNLIQNAYKTGSLEDLDLNEIEKSIIIDDKLRRQPELTIPYLYHTAKQLMFYGKLLDNRIEKRDALYIVPRNIRLSTLENYDLINLIDLELPLRMCKTCEPERYATSWKKRDIMAKETRNIPYLDYFLQPKCNIGFCTEEPYCKHITDLREYNKDLHKATKKIMLSK